MGRPPFDVRLPVVGELAGEKAAKLGSDQLHELREGTSRNRPEIGLALAHVRVDPVERLSRDLRVVLPGDVARGVKLGFGHVDFFDRRCECAEITADLLNRLID